MGDRLVDVEHTFAKTPHAALIDRSARCTAVIERIAIDEVIALDFEQTAVVIARVADLVDREAMLVGDALEPLAHGRLLFGLRQLRCRFLSGAAPPLGRRKAALGGRGGRRSTRTKSGGVAAAVQRLRLMLVSLLLSRSLLRARTRSLRTRAPSRPRTASRSLRSPRSRTTSAPIR